MINGEDIAKLSADMKSTEFSADRFATAISRTTAFQPLSDDQIVEVVDVELQQIVDSKTGKRSLVT